MLNLSLPRLRCCLINVKTRDKMLERIFPQTGDSLTQDQFFDNFRRRRFLEPERELMLAVLADAVECYWKYSRSRDGTGVRLFHEAQEWLFDDDERPFSFINICATLQLEPQYVRRGVFARRYSAVTQGKRDDTALRMSRPRYVRRNLQTTRHRALRAPTRRPRAR